MPRRRHTRVVRKTLVQKTYVAKNVTLFAAFFVAIVAVAANANPASLEPTATAGPAREKLLAEAAEATALAAKLWAVADTVDRKSSLGTMYNEVDATKHKCYALGVLLNQPQAVRHLRFNRNPPLHTRDFEDAHTLRVNARSLNNFKYSVKRVLSVAQPERAMEWNLDCVGKLSIRGQPMQIAGESTFYRYHADQNTLQVLGDIKPGFAEKLREALNRHRSVRTISLGSGGGSVYEAIEGGRLIRSRRIETTLSNNCYSACPLVFFGGVSRRIWSPYPSFGFHKVSSPSGAVPMHSPVYRDILAYISEMGVDSRYVLENMLRAEPEEMNMVRASPLHLHRIA